MRVFVFRIVGEVSREQDQVRTLWQSVYHLHRAFKGFCAQGIGRAVKPHMGIAQLKKGEGRNRLTVFLAQFAKKRASFPFRAR